MLLYQQTTSMSQVSISDEIIPEGVNWEHCTIYQNAKPATETEDYEADNEEEHNDDEAIKEIATILAKALPFSSSTKSPAFNLFLGLAPPETQYPDPGSDSEEDDILLQGYNIRDQDTTFGKYFTKSTVTESQSLLFDDNKEQLKNARHFLSSLSKPLAIAWTYFGRTLVVLIVLINLILVMYDIFQEDNKDQMYNQVAVAFSWLELVVFAGMYFGLRWRKKKYEKSLETKRKSDGTDSDHNMNEDSIHSSNISQIIEIKTEHTEGTSKIQDGMEMHKRNKKIYEPSNSKNKDHFSIDSLQLVSSELITDLNYKENEYDEKDKDETSQLKIDNENTDTDNDNDNNQKPSMQDDKTEQMTKQGQYIENLITEFFLYILIIISVFGAATDRNLTVWNKFKCNSIINEIFWKKCIKYWLEKFLLIFDVFDLIYNQFLLILIIHRILKGIEDQIIETEDQDDGVSKTAKYCSWNVIQRARITLIGNIGLFFTMIGILYMQVWFDNPVAGEEKYNGSTSSWLIVICLILLPNVSAILFFLANSYWILKLFIQVNVSMGDEKHQKEMEDEFGYIVADALAFAAKKAEESKQRLEDLDNLSSQKRILYCLSEISAVILIFVWCCMVCTVIGALIIDLTNFPEVGDIKSLNWLPYFLIGIYLVVIVIVNHHLVLLSLIIVLLIIPFIIGFVFYPFAIYLLFYKKAKVANTEDQV